MLTGKMKGIAFCIVFNLFILFAHIFIRNRKKLKVRYLVLVGLGLSLVASGKIESTIFNTRTARGTLYNTCVKIANDHFPLGTGFGTFGTEFSRKTYSIIYSIYGISSVWGLSQEYSNFIADTYWPGIIGETGYIGLIAILLLLFFLFLNVLKLKTDNFIKIGLLGFLVYIIAISIGDSIFMSPRGFTLMYIFSFFLTYIYKDKRKYS
jgi:hypothetical protein